MERRRGILLVLTVVLISWFGSFLNKVSFDPNYSAIDVFSSASEKAKKQKSAKQIEDGIIHGLMFSCQKKRAIKKKRLL